MKSLMDNKDLFIFNLFGTSYMDNDIFEDNYELFRFLEEKGKKVFFLTNESSKSVYEYIGNFARLGIIVKEEAFVTVTDAAIEYMKKNQFKKVYVCGSKTFRQQIKRSGIKIVETIQAGIDCVMMGLDPELTYDKMDSMCVLLNNKIPFVITDTYDSLYSWHGPTLGCGAVSEMISKITGIKPICVGKPDKFMVELAVEKAEVSKNKTVIIGNDYDFDVVSGKNAGITTVMLKGEHLDISLSRYGDADYIITNLKKLYNEISK